MQYQVLVDDLTFEVELSEQGILLDGEQVEVRAHRLSEHTLHVLVGNRSYVFTLEPTGDGTLRATYGGRTREVRLKNERDLLLERMGIGLESDLGPAELRAPMPGLVLQVLVEPGQTVAPGDGLVVLEAMKMENELRADSAGTVSEVHIQPGAPVGKNDLLVSFAD